MSNSGAAGTFSGLRPRLRSWGVASRSRSQEPVLRAQQTTKALFENAWWVVVEETELRLVRAGVRVGSAAVTDVDLFDWDDSRRAIWK